MTSSRIPEKKRRENYFTFNVKSFFKSFACLRYVCFSHAKNLKTLSPKKAFGFLGFLAGVPIPRKKGRSPPPGSLRRIFNPKQSKPILWNSSSFTPALSRVSLSFRLKRTTEGGIPPGAPLFSIAQLYSLGKKQEDFLVFLEEKQ